ncbi:MAG TPA: 3'-5' exonuclease [Steroidobacteraceae bacterium]|nr:3'-5' exonuclease [Steroidobacteraceae bacterium]
MNSLVFDLETIPDVELGRRLYGLEGLADAQVASAMFSLRRQASGKEFLPHLQQRIVAISCALRSRDGLKLWSLGEPHAPEQELITRFFDGLERYAPVLVSWNGCGFDLPVLHYRALKAGVQAPRYWETGDEDPAFRYSNYLNRYHWRHVDLMSVLAAHQVHARASLAHTAALLGLPGKLGFDGARVWEAWLAGNIVGIRRYCETDVLNTYLVYLRFELMRGHLTPERHAEELERVRRLLREGTEPHHREFLQAWESAGGLGAGGPGAGGPGTDGSSGSSGAGGSRDASDAGP